MTTPKIPADGPAAMLARISALLKLGHGREQIVHAVATHPRPTSLLALVDVGGQLGLKITPAKTTGDALKDLNLPFVAHFDGSGGGFGLVENFTTSGLDVWDSANGLRTIPRGDFLTQWSGIVGLIEAGDEARSRNDLRRRVGDLIAGGPEPPAVVGSPTSVAVRSALIILATALVALGVAAQPAALRVPTMVLVVLSVAGLILTSLMSIAISDYGGPFSPGMCKRGRFVDCQSVLASRFAKVLGVPLSDLGISFYASALLLVAASASGATAVPAVLGTVFIATLPVAIALIGAQIAMRRLCTLCLGVHAVNATAAAVGWLYVLDTRRPSGAVETSLLWVLFFSLTLFFVIPYLKDNRSLARLTSTYGRMSASPYASLAQLVTEAPTDLAGPVVGIRLGDGTARNELVAFLHPSCLQCEPVLREIRTLAKRDSIDVFVSIPPKDETERRLCESLIAIGLAAGPEAMSSAFGAAKERFRELLVADPEPILTAEVRLAPDAIAAAAVQARAITERAESFAANHVEGTPMVFFNSLPFRGPLAHLVALLEHHAELLPPARRAPEEATRS